MQSWSRFQISTFSCPHISAPSTLVFTQHVPTPQKLQERDAAQSSQKSCRNNKGHSSFCPQTTPRLGSSQGNPRKKHAKLKGGGGTTHDDGHDTTRKSKMEAREWGWKPNQNQAECWHMVRACMRRRFFFQSYCSIYPTNLSLCYIDQAGLLSIWHFLLSARILPWFCLFWDRVEEGGSKAQGVSPLGTQGVCTGSTWIWDLVSKIKQKETHPQKAA